MPRRIVEQEYDMERKNRHSESELTPEERRLEQLLFEALGVTPPAGLADRVAQASVTSIAGVHDQRFEYQLDAACSYPCPEDLASGVYAASVSTLLRSTAHDSDAVVARIGQPVHWQKVALAACLTFAALVAIRVGVSNHQNTGTLPMIAHNNVLSVEEEELLLDDLNLSEYIYLADTREFAFADLRYDIELWQYGLLTE